jgi:hypothetical protein
MPRTTRVIHRRKPRQKGAPVRTIIWVVDSEKGITQYCGRKRVRLHDGPYRSDWSERIRVGHFSKDQTIVSSWARVEHRDARGLITGVESVWVPSRVDALQYRKRLRAELERRQAEQSRQEWARAGPAERTVILMRDENRRRMAKNV